MSRVLRIGTRGSRLALWQARFVAARLEGISAAEPVVIETSGDRQHDAQLAQIGGQGLFTKEIQKALLDGHVDVAVHSLKDLPTRALEGLVLAAIPPRGPAGDAFVSHRYRSFADLPPGAQVGTSSPRRKAQLLHKNPALCVVNLRGNVETRLRRLHAAPLDAIILAHAGLERLELSDSITEILDPSWMLPAVGQGAIGIECRQDDADAIILLSRLDHLPTRQAVAAERAFLEQLQGGCQVPIGAFAKIVDSSLSLQTAILSADGTNRVAGSLAGPATEAEAIGRQLAQELLSRGGAALLGLPEQS